MPGLIGLDIRRRYRLVEQVLQIGELQHLLQRPDVLGQHRMLGLIALHLLDVLGRGLLQGTGGQISLRKS